MAIGINWAEVWKPVWKAVWTNVAPEPPAPPSTQKPAGAPAKRRRRLLEVDGERFAVESESEAAFVLQKLKEAAAERAKLAVARAAKAPKRAPKKVLADARKLLEEPVIQAPEEFQPIVTAVQHEISEMYRVAMMSVEIAAFIAKRQAEEEDDEDVLLLAI